MKNVHCLIENRRRNQLIQSIQKYISYGNELTEKMEFVSEPLVFSKSNAPVVLMNLKNAVKEIKNAKIRADVYLWANEVVKNGKEAIGENGLFHEIDELDVRINLRSAEFFELKQLLILAASEAFKNALEITVYVQKMAMRAEAWLKKDGLSMESDDVFFLEHVLKLLRETEKPEKLEIVHKQLEYIGKDENETVEIYSKTMSDLLLRLTNVVSLIHTVNNIDWLDAYEKLSRTEAILISEKGNVYKKLDEESKNQIRRSIEEMSIQSGFSENTIASAASQLVTEKIFADITEALYTDKGRETVLGKLNAKKFRLSKMIPDPNGRKLIFAQIAGTAILLILSATVFPLIACVFLFPVIWTAVSDVSRFVVSKRIKSHPLLCLKMEKVPPESRTLVVVPALLTGKDSASKLAKRLSEHGVHEKDENIDFLLLCDFKDSKKQEIETDEEAEKCLHKEIQKLNKTSEREKYFYLQRARSFNESDGIWMGRERKRGAIEDLNRLIVTGENRFKNAEDAFDQFYGRYTYLLTMDSDTRILPGEIRKLIGMISHPLNYSYSVIQPRMETISGNKRSMFAQSMSGIGGTDHYDICAADFYQDLTGEGLFSGKGIIRIREFFEKTAEAFQENTVLSHDIIEGILTKAAFAGNRVMFESFPETPDAFLKRLDRWTRGDWQLIHYLFGRIRMNALGRYKILSSIIRSLKAASVILTIVLSLWYKDIFLLAFALAAHFLPVLLNGTGAAASAVMNFVLLPSIAYTELRAAGTAIARLYVTKQKRLEWVTAAETINRSNGTSLHGIFVSLFLIPGLFYGETMALSLLIGSAFAFGNSAVYMLDKTTSMDAVTTHEFGYLSDIAKAIWKYFEKYVPITGNGLPPDNVQFDPNVGVQYRTSPTNIGMYILSAIGACELGLIEKEEAVIRLKNTLNSLNTLDTFEGMFFNWYDSVSLRPVYPKYVSSVDLGNLIAALAAARNFLSEDEALFKEYQMLIDRMNIAFLYNDRKKLFRIGYDAENNRLSASHYDLFASEARILSYVSMAEKGIEIKHWKRLGRPFAMIGKKPVLLSWSGTMFEYMMPGLILPSTYKSLIRNTEKNITEIQKRRGKNGVWGISESAYCAFDRDLNYQYQAFGISDLALSGAQNGKVFSPYSVILSLEHSKESAIACLEKLTEMGLKGEYGFYEAVDMTQADSPKIVYSYMTHHQGMSFISLVNYLTGNKIKKLFMLDPKESSLLPLLSEKPFTTPLVKMLFEKRNKSILMDMENENLTPPGDFTRYARKSVNEGHILFCGDALLYFEQNGRSFYRKNGIYANRFSADASRKRDSILPVISDSSGTARLEKCLFDTGYVTCELSTGLIDAKVTLTLNPENGHMLIKGEIKSKKQEKVKVTVEHAFALCLTDEENMYAHPVFSDLFIRDENIDSIGKRYFRKDRNTLREDIQLIHMTDDNAVTPKSNERTHTKCAVLKRDITAQPNRKQELYFETGIVSKAMAHANAPDKSRFDKAVIMLRAQMNAHIEFCGLKASEYRNTDRSTVRLFSLSAKKGKEKLIPECLWPLGISGDSPVIMAHVVQKSSVQALKKLLRAQEFFRYAGITLPIVVLHVKEADYFTPLSDEIRLILASANLTPGRDAFVFSEDELTEEQKMTLRALSVISVKHDFLKDTALDKKAHEEKASENKRLPSKHTENADLFEDNGYGGFLPDQIGYQIRVSESCLPPRRWSNFLANPDFGVMTNDLGISHVYYENSRMGRITPFSNNLDLPGTAIELDAYEDRCRIGLTPGAEPIGEYTVTFKPGETVYTAESENILYETICFTDIEKPVFYAMVNAVKKTEGETEVRFASGVNYLMGTDERDLRFTRLDGEMAYGKCGFAAVSGFDESKNRIVLRKGDRYTVCFMLCAFIKDKVQNPDYRCAEEALKKSRDLISQNFGAITVDTGNYARDQIVNGFLKAQTLFSRFYARFGPYQPGGAFGMRDQMQDLLSIMYFDRKITREHLILCASKQFEKGDALHWWHMPSSGVRTRISDDILFLPVVTVKYIDLSGDKAILSENIPFLRDVPIPSDQEDLYRTFEETEHTAPLYDHIMRAFRYVNRKGSHGLLLMGTGDWNDGMNRIGHKGRGESVWLSEFFVYAANEFAHYALKEDRDYLRAEAQSVMDAIEKYAWDGDWYIRAFDDEGNKIGSKESEECRIDLISQAWAVIAGMNHERAKRAIRSCEEHLINYDAGYIRLLTPPFTGKTVHPGYISAYPEGVRENGGQYTHAACWLVKAYALLGMADEAWKAFDMLLPVLRTNTKEKAAYYGGEPYVISADISDHPDAQGVCGWTWYTGAAAWAERIMIEDLMGISIREDEVSMNALLPSDADEMSVSIRKGESLYKLTAKRNTEEKTKSIRLIDDGLVHNYVFPIRK